MDSNSKFLEESIGIGFKPVQTC